MTDDRLEIEVVVEENTRPEDDADFEQYLIDVFAGVYDELEIEVNHAE